MARKDFWSRRLVGCFSILAKRSRSKLDLRSRTSCSCIVIIIFNEWINAATVILSKFHQLRASPEIKDTWSGFMGLSDWHCKPDFFWTLTFWNMKAALWSRSVLSLARIVKKLSMNFSSELWRLITCFSFPFMLSRRLSWRLYRTQGSARALPIP